MHKNGTLDRGRVMQFAQNEMPKPADPGYKYPWNKKSNPQLWKFDFRPNFVYNIDVKKKYRRLTTSITQPGSNRHLLVDEHI